ncbi:MAG: glycosyltransferase family 10 [Chloroflexales bacterium]
MIRVFIPKSPTCEFITGVARNMFEGHEGFEISNSPYDTDVIIASHFGDGAYHLPRAVKIFLDGESGSEYAGERDKPLSASFDADIYIGPTANHSVLEKMGISCEYVPFASLSFGQRNKHAPPDLLIKNPVTEQKKDLFCAYLAYNPIPRRENFFDVLKGTAEKDGMGVDALGECSGTFMKTVRPSTRFSPGWLDEAVDLLRPYRLAMAFENENVAGYVTEKLVNAYLAGCVPLYSGTEDAFEMFNKASLVYIDEFDSFSSAVSRILTIAKDKELYADLRAQSPLVNGALHQFFSWHRSVDGDLGNKIRNLVQMKLKVKGQ